MAYYRTGFGTGATADGKTGISDLSPELLPLIKVNVPVFLEMHPDEMNRDVFYPFYIRMLQAIERRPTIDLLVDYEKSRGASGGSKIMLSIPQALRDVRHRIMLQWYHACPYRFHDLVDILYNPDTPQAIKDICKKLLDDFMAHLDSIEECGECKIIRREDTKLQIHQIIEGTFKPDTVESRVRRLVLEYEKDPVTTEEKYGHLCVWKTGSLDITPPSPCI